MFKLLYKTGKSEKESLNLKPIEKLEEKEIQKFFEENLESIFPELKGILPYKKNGTREKSTKYPFNGGELDAIYWFPREQFFIIFEYKSEKPWQIIEQILRYLGAFSEEHGKECIKLLNRLNELHPKNKETFWKHDEIKWKNLKLIWISPDLPSYYKNPFFSNVIVWLRSEWYQGNNERIVRLESEDKNQLLRKLQNELVSVSNKDLVKDQKTQLPQFLKKSEQENTFIELHKWIKDKLEPLLEKNPHFFIKLQQKRYRIRDKRVSGNNIIFDILFKNPFSERKSKLKNPKIFLVAPSENLIKKYSLTKKDGKDIFSKSFEYVINNFQEAYNLLSQFIEEKYHDTKLNQ